MARVPRCLSIVLAGGEGKRLMPLTMDRAKPAVPFGGTYRLIDFVLSNLANAGMRQIAVLTQYKSHSLDRHISLTWRMSTMLGNYVTPVPAQQRLGPRWYQGSADAIYQSMNLINDEQPDYVVVFGADNIYRMDVSQMLDAHIDGGLGCTVAGIRVPRSQATRVRRDRRRPPTTRSTRSWRSRPTRPACPTTRSPRSPRWATTSSPTDALIEALQHRRRVTTTPGTTWAATSSPPSWPAAMPRSTTSPRNAVPGTTDRDRAYWRDVGTIDAYHEAHMDLVSVDPVFNLYNMDWPIWTYPVQMPGAKFTLRGPALDSIVSPGCIISGGSIDELGALARTSGCRGLQGGPARCC